MKKLLAIALSLGVFPLSGLQAQSSQELSGSYQHLLIGVDPAQGTVSGYYKELYEPPNRPYLECSFYLTGKKKGGVYEVQAWSPRDKNPKVATGELSFFSADNQIPSVLLKLDKLDRDCTVLQPNILKDQGAYFDLKKSGAWTQVRMVSSNTPYYQTPDASSPTRDNAKRGTVLSVMQQRRDWAQVQADQKPKGWIREVNFYPLDPTAVVAETSLPFADKQTIPPAKAVAPPVVKKETAPPPQVEAAPVVPKKVETSAPAAPTVAQEPESKEIIIARLKALNAEAFVMALQVLKDPVKRKDLSSKRIEMEKELDSVVSQLNNVAPSAYAKESKEISEAYLDLRYVEQAQPVVSLRLNKVIQNIEK